MQRERAVILLSGGLDSVTMAYYLRHELNCDISLALSFNYGQRHKKEIDFARLHAEILGAEHRVVDLASVTDLLAGSSLTQEDLAVPDGHYAEETMKKTVVPNRNAIMLAIAYGAAVSRGYDLVATAVHAGDHYIYPDCRPKFIQGLNRALGVGCEDFAKPHLKIVAPFVMRSKTDIASIAGSLGIAIEHTWSCYKGGELHCGTCGTCYERQEALMQAKVADPTQYQVKLEEWLKDQEKKANAISRA